MPLSLSSRRVLVVEDNPLLALPLIELLLACGALPVGPLGTVECALRALAGPIDAAVLDVDLGSEQVWPVAEALRGRDVPFVFATGSTNEVRFPEPLRNIQRFCKPYVPAAVIQALGQCLEIPH